MGCSRQARDRQPRQPEGGLAGGLGFGCSPWSSSTWLMFSRHAGRPGDLVQCEVGDEGSRMSRPEAAQCLQAAPGRRPFSEWRAAGGGEGPLRQLGDALHQRHVASLRASRDADEPPRFERSGIG